MKKIKLLCCIHDLRGRGAQKILATLLTKFDREKYDLGVFVFHDNDATKIPADVEILSAHLSAAPVPFDLFSAVRQFVTKTRVLTKALNRFKPDVVLSVAGTEIHLVFARYLSRTKPKIILSQNALPSAVSKTFDNRLESYLIDKAMAITYRRAEMIVATSEGCRIDLHSFIGIPLAKIDVILNPLDVNHIASVPASGPGIEIPDDGSFRVGFVGSLTKEKNVQCLLRGVAKARERGLPVRLFIVGDGAERAGLEGLSRELKISDSVCFLGFQADPPYGIMKTFDALALPSLFEILPYALLEAMACGVPVITSKWPYSEYLFHDGENCLLFPVNDHDALSRAIEKLMNDTELQTRLVTNGQALLDMCDVDTVVRHYDEAISRVLGGGGSERS